VTPSPSSPSSHTAPAASVARAEPADWEVWREVRLRSLRTDPDAFGSAWQRERDFTEEQWRERLASSYAVLARPADRPDAPVVGIGGLFTSAPGESTVVAMWVLPEERGQGVGRAVLEHLLRAAPTGDRLVLWVADGNPAVHLYADLGFVATGVREPIRPGASLMKSEMERPGPPASPLPASGGLGG
jgi:GNAT superfamily N-acetyltransferase